MTSRTIAVWKRKASVRTLPGKTASAKTTARKTSKRKGRPEGRPLRITLVRDGARRETAARLTPDLHDLRRRRNSSPACPPPKSFPPGVPVHAESPDIAAAFRRAQPAQRRRAENTAVVFEVEQIEPLDQSRGRISGDQIHLARRQRAIAQRQSITCGGSRNRSP